METRKENIAYKNAYGDTISKSAKRFFVRGTIMTARRQMVGNHVCHELYVEDSEGGYHVTVWDSAIGYDKQKLRQGMSVAIKGVATHTIISGADGRPLRVTRYHACEIQ